MVSQEVLEYRAGEDNKVGTADDRFFAKFEDIALALNVALSVGEFAKCVNALKFTSDFFRGEVVAIVPKTSTRTKAAFILKKDQGSPQGPKLVFWQEE